MQRAGRIGPYPKVNNQYDWLFNTIQNLIGLQFLTALSFITESFVSLSLNLPVPFEELVKNGV